MNVTSACNVMSGLVKVDSTVKDAPPSWPIGLMTAAPGVPPQYVTPVLAQANAPPDGVTDHARLKSSTHPPGAGTTGVKW